MAFTTKLPLINAKFYKDTATTLDLSGTTNFEAAYYMSAPTIINPLQIPHAGYVTGQSAALKSQIDYISGVTDTVSGLTVTNAADIVTVSGLTVDNAADIATVSGLTVDNAADIATVSGLTETNATDIATVSGLTETNAADIATVSGLTETNATDIATVSGLTETNATDIATVSGLTETNATDIATVSGLTETNATDIATVSGLTETNATDIATVSGLTETNATDIATVSGLTETNATDIATVSGLTETNATAISANASDISNLGGISGITNASITGVTNGLTKDGAHSAKLGGSLTENTTINVATHDLKFSGDSVQYTADYSGTFVDRSLVDKEYVDNATGGIDAANGLTKVDGNITLGGSLTGNTDINLATYDLKFSGDSVQYTGDYSSTYVARSLPDAEYVTGLTEGLQSQITYVSGQTDLRLITTDFNTYSATTDTRLDTIEDDITGNTAAISANASDITNLGAISGITNASITGVTNGLTKVGSHSARLGGSLTENTTINLATSDLKFSGDSIQYTADYSSTYVARSIPDAAWVTGQTGSISANNGLTRAGDYVSLGGVLTGDTEIGVGTGTLTISAPLDIDDAQNIIFDSAPVISGNAPEGSLYYSACSLNFAREIAGVTLQIGEEQVIRVENVTGGLLANGTVVYINGSAAFLPTIDKSDATDYNSTNTVGILTHDIAHNNEGYVTTQGIVRGVNTTGFAEGDELYINPSAAGTFTNVEPSHPNFVVRVGYVTNVGTTDGEIFVSVAWEADHVTIDQFTGYTATTETAIDNKLETSIFETYTGDTEAVLTGITEITDIALTGVTNGLTKVGSHSARLGGTLTQGTTISGAQTLNIQPSCNLTLRTVTDRAMQLDAQSNGSITIKSQSGTVDNAASFTTSVGFLIDYDSGFKAYDRRIGSNQSGISYDADYSLNYVDRSLVDKAYVDSVATGLNAKAAVSVVTTVADGNLDLSGLTSPATIDGITLTDGMRVLVSKQTDATENGIYLASGDTWNRAEDYDGAPTGEVNNGDLVPVITGNTWASTQWIQTTPDPITIGVSELEFSLFSQLLQISAGDGIAIAAGNPKVISVDLATNSGLEFSSGNLTVANEIAGSGLTFSNGVLDVNASTAAFSGDEIAVKFGTGNALFVDRGDFSYTTASNGLTKVDSNVTLGGTLTGDTNILGASSHSLAMINLDAFTLSFECSNITDNSGSEYGLQYSGDYSGGFLENSLVSKLFVNSAITGGTLLTATNGLTKVGGNIQWGSTTPMAVDKAVLRGQQALCIKNTGVETISDCSCSYVQPTTINNYTCNASGCISQVDLNNDGTMSIVANNATQGLTITSAAHGAVYAGDYSANYVARSIPDAAWVTGQTGAIDANNGLTRAGDYVSLGGALTGDTTITADEFSFSIVSGGSSGFNFEVNPTTDVFDMSTEGGAFITVDGLSDAAGISDTTGANLTLLMGDFILSDSTGNASIQSKTEDIQITGNIFANTTPDVGDTSDVVLVRNSSFGEIKTITVASITGATAFSFSNGITESANAVKLGGALTETTTINGAQTMRFNVSNFNVTGATDITGAVGITGAITASGAADLNSTLNVAGATSLQSTLNVTGNTDITGTLDVGGALTLDTVGAGSTSDSVLTVTSGGVVEKIDASSLGEDNNRYETTGLTNSTINLLGGEYVVLVGTGSAAVTVNLPQSPSAGWAFKIKDATGNALTNNITIDPYSTETIDGASTATINTNYGALEIMFSGTEWNILSFLN